ncbi:Protein FAM107B [Manis javanica]|nr:Protein FAM107B [Manis javanica]
MAEPDYIEDDNPELIRPQKLVNPVKTSRNHQDLHRELLMNQKRGLAPQNKPELQKVMEKRKRDQVIKQKEEEAQKKKSDLEIELLKRQQKLEQLEVEKQKLQEEQENAPEFVKLCAERLFLHCLGDDGAVGDGDADDSWAVSQEQLKRREGLLSVCMLAGVHFYVKFEL